MPTTEQVEWWLRTGSVYGLGFVLLAGLVFIGLYLTFRGSRALLGLVDDCRTHWLPKIVGGHLDFLEHTKVTNARVADATERLTESYGVSSDNHGVTQRALEHVVEAAKDATKCEDVHEHLEAALKELRRKP